MCALGLTCVCVCVCVCVWLALVYTVPILVLSKYTRTLDMQVQDKRSRNCYQDIYSYLSVETASFP